MSELKKRVFDELGLAQFEKGEDILRDIFKYSTWDSFSAAYDNHMSGIDEEELKAYLDLAAKLRPQLEAMYVQFLEFASEFADDEGEVLQ